MSGSLGFVVRAMPISHDFPTLARAGGYLCYVPLQYSHYHIDLSLSFDDYKRKFSSKTRSTLQRKVRRFERHCAGATTCRRFQTPADMSEFFPLARKVSKLTYQERLLDAGLPGDRAFIRDAQALAARDQLRAYILFDGKRPVSYLYCPIAEGVVMYRYLGYDPAYRHLSVGTVLQWLALEDLFAERRFTAFDFTEGRSEHKRLFATHSRRCANVFILRDSLKTNTVVYGHRIVDRLSNFLGRILDHAGCKATVRRAVRFGAWSRRYLGSYGGSYGVETQGGLGGTR